MATFNTVDELIRILDDDPQLREALRARMLPQELLGLPAAHAAFVKEMRAFVVKTDAFVAGMEEFRAETQAFITGMEEFRAETQAFITGMEEFRAETQAFMSEMREFIAAANRRFDTIDNRLDSLELRVARGFNRLNHDIGTLRGNYAENAVRRQAITIAFNIGGANGYDFDETTLRELDRDSLVKKAAQSGIISDIPQGERASFYASDFVAEVCDEAGETHYIVVEASYTCDKSDTDRAISHAELMTRFTGRKSWPAIAGARLDNEVQHVVDAGDVFWLRFAQDEFRSDFWESTR